MRFYLLLCFSLIFSQGNTLETTQSNKPKEAEYASKIKTLPLAKEDRFAIYYNAEEPLNAALKETMIKHFQKIGAVYHSDDSKLSEKQKEDKYRPGGMIIEISASQIVEENGSSSSKCTKLPVVEVNMKVVGGVEILQNGSQLPGVLWEKEKFIGVASEKKELVKKAVKVLDSMLDSFSNEYQRANPTPESKKPQFFFYY